MTSDLRTFLKEAEEKNLVYRVTKEVDPLGNVAALCDESDRILRFENVKGYEGWTVVANTARDRPIEAVAFRTTPSGVVPAFAAGLDRGPRPHRVVADGPVQEVVWTGDDADATRLPVCYHSELDGGPYIGSGIGIVVDPETGLHNTTFPRMMVRNGRKIPFLIYSPHVAQIFGKYARQKRRMPMAVVIGHHPAWEFMGASSLHHPHCGELDYVGSLLEEETTFVRCRTIPVDVPTHAEIVIEGEVVPGEIADEGPYGNYLGTYASTPTAVGGVQKGNIFEVKAITMRKKPIFRHLQGTVWTDHQRLCMLPIEASLFTALREMGIDVHDVYNPSWGACSTTLIQMTPIAPGQVRDALLKALEWENTTLGFMSQIAIAVNRDVNVYDARDVVWAMAIRANWAKDSLVVQGTRASPIMPMADRVPGVPFRIGGKMALDATHLPPRDETEKWEINRVWPMGKDTVRIEDFVEGFDRQAARQVRVAMPIPVATTADMLGAASATAEAGGLPPGPVAPEGVSFVPVAKLSELEEGAGRCVEVKGEQVALFRVGSRVYAINNICPHLGGSIAEGPVEGTTVVCPLHGWCFDVTSGKALQGAIGVEAYPVRIEGDVVEVALPG